MLNIAGKILALKSENGKGPMNGANSKYGISPFGKEKGWICK